MRQYNSYAFGNHKRPDCDNIYTFQYVTYRMLSAADTVALQSISTAIESLKNRMKLWEVFKQI